MNDRPIPPALPARRLVPILGILMATAPTSIDMYLPALPSLANSFRASQSAVALTLSSFLLGFGLGQLFWGPLSDRIGRRRPAIAGLALYVIASVGCAYSTSVSEMILWRLLQALGGCAAPALALAMVRDSFHRDQSARILSLMGLISSMAPLFAPIIGGQILRWFAWPAIFWTLAIFGFLGLTGLFLIPETLPAERRPPPRWGEFLSGYGELITNRRYLGYIFCIACFMAAMFAYIAGTPFVYIGYFHVPPQLYGLLFGVNVLGIILLNVANSRVVLRYGSDRLLRLGCSLGALFSVVLAVTGSLGIGGIFGVAVPLFCFISMLGLIYANAIAGALSGFAHKAGAAAALCGSVQFGVGALSGGLVGRFSAGTPTAMCVVVAIFGNLSLLSYLLLVRPGARSVLPEHATKPARRMSEPQA